MSSSERSQAPKISRTTAADHAQAQGEGQRLFTLLAPTVAAHQLFLEDVSVVVAGSHRTVSVVVDLEQDQTGGVSLDTIAEISRAISDALDADPHDDGRAYDLEVSSPGTSRPLTEPRHWHRALGRVVKVNPVGEANFTGRITAVDDAGVTFVPDIPVKKGMRPKTGEPVTLAFEQIRRGTVEVEFSHIEHTDLDLDFETGSEAAGEED